MGSFFSSGAVDVKSFDRSKLSEGVYRVRLVDAADHIGAQAGNRTQFDFVVVKGPNSIGMKKGTITMHSHAKDWMVAKARGEIAANLGAFMGLTREASGLKVTPEVFDEHTRTVNYVGGGKDVAGVSRGSEDLPLVKAGAEAILVVKPYFDKKTGQRKVNPKTGEKSVTYDLLPLSCGFVADEPGSLATETDDETPPALDDEPAVDPLDLALADGWKANGPKFFYKKGEPAQLKADDLRAKYSQG